MPTAALKSVSEKKQMKNHWVQRRQRRFYVNEINKWKAIGGNADSGTFIYVNETNKWKCIGGNAQSKVYMNQMNK